MGLRRIVFEEAKCTVDYVGMKRDGNAWISLESAHMAATIWAIVEVSLHEDSLLESGTYD